MTRNDRVAFSIPVAEGQLLTSATAESIRSAADENGTKLCAGDPLPGTPRGLAPFSRPEPHKVVGDPQAALSICV